MEDEEKFMILSFFIFYLLYQVGDCGKIYHIVVNMDCKAVILDVHG